MTPHIIVQGSILKYAELPPKRSIHNPDKPTKEYQEAIESAMEVHPESVNFVNRMIYPINGYAVYPIQAKVRIVETCKWNGDKNSCGNETCWDLGECQKSPSKQYAILEPENSAHGFTEGSETVYNQTGVITTCNGIIGSNGVCNKCFHIVQTSSSHCGRLVPVLDVESKVLPDQLPKEFLIAYSGMTE